MSAARSQWKRPLLRFIILVVCALLLQGLPLVFSLLPGNTGTAVYFLYLYGLLPLAALLLAGWAGMGGVHPMAAFFPIGLAEMLLAVYPSTGVGMLCLLLSLLGATAGNEIVKRRKRQSKPRKASRS